VVPLTKRSSWLKSYNSVDLDALRSHVESVNAHSQASIYITIHSRSNFIAKYFAAAWTIMREKYGNGPLACGERVGVSKLERHLHLKDKHFHFVIIRWVMVMFPDHTVTAVNYAPCGSEFIPR
jgi:hypothetical protein